SVARRSRTTRGGPSGRVRLPGRARSRGRMMGATTVRQIGQASNARGEPMTRKATTAPRSLAALQRQQRAIELRRAGRSYREIARQVGIGVASAHRLITAAIADVRATVQDDAVEMRALELSRLDGLL